MALVLGLDIGERALRGALLKTSYRSHELRYFTEVPINAPDHEGIIPNLGSAVRDVLINVGEQPDRIVTGLPGHMASLRTLTLDLEERAIGRAKEVIPFELERQLPFPIEEVVVDHQNVEYADGKLRVATAAVRKEVLAKEIERWAMAGVDPREMAAGAWAFDGLSSVCADLQHEEPTLFMELSHNTADLCIFRNSECIVARTLSHGIREPFRLKSAVQRTLTAIRASEIHPTRCFVSGPGFANLGSNRMDHDLSPFVGDLGDMPTRGLSLPDTPRGETARPQFARAIALATRSLVHHHLINMRTGPFAPLGGLGDIKSYLRLGAVALPALLCSFLLATCAKRSSLESQNETLKARLANVTTVLTGQAISDPEQAQKALFDPSRSNNPVPPFDALDTLKHVSQSVPEDVRHMTRKLEIDLEEDGKRGRFLLQGTVSGVSARDKIIKHLTSVDCFHEVKGGRTTPAPGNEGVNYEIEGQMECNRKGKKKPKGTKE